MPENTIEMDAVVARVEAHAAECGRTDCGHLYRGHDDAVRRATILFLAEENGLDVDLDLEPAAVAALVGVLRSSRTVRTVYRRPGVRTPRPSATREVADLPDMSALRMTPERIEVYTLMVQGVALVRIAERLNKNIETIKSHAGNLRRGAPLGAIRRGDAVAAAHDAPSALLALVIQGSIPLQ